ncbi:MAG: tetratricopeptide repeat protein [Raineya sp.]|nr:tetratricopeptide repeat protein [Raineya sp.]
MIRKLKFLLIVFFLTGMCIDFAFSQKKSKGVSAEQIRQWIEQGEAEWEVSNYQDAISWFNRAIKADSSIADVYFKRAKSWVQLKKFENALKDLLTADSLGYKDSEHDLYLGVSWFGLQNYKKSLEYLEKFEATAPKDSLQASLYVHLAECYKELGRKKDAIRAYQKAIELKPDDADIYFLRANFWVMQEEWKEALKDVEKVLVLHPRFWKAYKLKAEILFRQGKDQASIEAWQVYFTKQPDKKKISAQDYSLYAYSLAQLKQYPQAVEAISKAIALDKENPEWYFERATYYILQKNYLKALQDTEKAIELDGEDLSYFRQRAFLYFELKKYEEALSDYVFLTQKDEKNPENHYRVAELKFLLQKSPQEYHNDILAAYQLGYPKEKMRPELQPYTQKKLGKSKRKRFLGIF